MDKTRKTRLKKPYFIAVMIAFTAIIALVGCSSDEAKVTTTTTEEKSSIATKAITTETEKQTLADVTEKESQTTAAQHEAENVTEETQDVVNTLDNFQVLCQFPELPTGCETTSLAMVLNHLGFSCDKCELSDNYLVKGAVGTVNFREAFEGDPRDENSYGCYAPVIANAANSYLSANGSLLSARVLDGCTLEELFNFTDEGTPVITWCTVDCNPCHVSAVWNVNGEELSWLSPEHCVVLLGYDDGLVRVADPYYGEIRQFDKEVFRASYQSLFSQAVVIE